MAEASSFSHSDYLDPATLAAVGGIELRARMIVEGLMTGMHRSPMHGVSVEFAQHRPYVPGDDTRHLDWKIFGRTDKLYLKQYQQETNLDLVVLVDTSGSMAYTSGVPSAGQSAANQTQGERRGGAGGRAWGVGAGGRAPAGWRKFDHAAALAAALSYLAIEQQDRAGLTVFAEHGRRATRLSNNRGHWRDIVSVLAGAELEIGQSDHEADPSQVANEDDQTESAASRSTSRSTPTPAPVNSPITANQNATRTDLLRLFDEVSARLARRSLICLISDLFDDPEHLKRGLARLAHRGHDLVVLQVMDPAELQFPFRAPSDFVGLEAEGRLPVDPASLRKAYLEVMRDHLERVEQIARNFQFDYLLMDTSQPIGPPLSHFLAKRAAIVGS